MKSKQAQVSLSGHHVFAGRCSGKAGVVPSVPSTPLPGECPQLPHRKGHRCLAETSPDDTQNKLGTELHKSPWEILTAPLAHRTALCLSRRLSQYTVVCPWAPAAQCRLQCWAPISEPSGHLCPRILELGCPHLGTRQKRQKQPNRAEVLLVMDRAQTPTPALISGPVTCRALGMIQSWTDTQTRCAYPPRLLSNGR